jgi:hypothetical protein
MRLFLSCLPGLLGLLFVPGASAAAPDGQVLNREAFHLRSGTRPEWDEFAQRTPKGRGLVLPFSSQRNEREGTLLIVQDNVKLDWPVELNGKRLGTLFLMEAPLVHTLKVPVGGLHDGTNTLSIVPPTENDDITVGTITLIDRPVGEAFSGAAIDVDVTERDGARHLPCRITVVRQDGALAPLVGSGDVQLAVRPGVVYTANGHARLGLPAGEYSVFANRGFAYGVGESHASVRIGETVHIRLQIAREVPTPGWISCDTHIHTGTFARHGDATVEERALTLAGEDIEMPVSTEHDQLVDFSRAAERTGTGAWFTPVIGDEVTTAQGHFNIFPVLSNAVPPDKKIPNWTKLMKAFRATPGVQVVVLNHPRNIHNNFQPFAATNFNAATGENLRGFTFTFDAIEVANSSALQSDEMINFRDWFALLNYGYRFTAVGSSDGHDVSRYIVGQGRTYIRSSSVDPARLDVQEVCRNLRHGRALVSLGLLTDMTVNGQFGVGDLATNLREQIHVAITVLGPSWVHADRVELYANGIKIRERSFPGPSDMSAFGAAPTAEGKPLRLEVAWDLPRPKHDLYLVALASGPGTRALYWPLARPYQPSSPTWNPRLIGATNPIWLDADGDGTFTGARAYAQRLVQESRMDAKVLADRLGSYDEAVRAQAASLLAERGAAGDSTR